jgi:hypothetical protein
MFSGLIARPLGHQYDHGSPNHHAATCEVLEIAREEKIFEEKPRRSASHKCISTLSMHLEMMPGCRYHAIIWEHFDDYISPQVRDWKIKAWKSKLAEALSGICLVTIRTTAMPSYSRYLTTILAKARRTAI